MAITYTLREPDGGTNYYTDNGFTYAAAAGWDDPSFFAIGPWLAPMLDQEDANRWLDLGWNTAFALTADSDLSILRQNGISAIIQQDEYTRFGTLGPEVVGLLNVDEPWEYSQIVTPIENTPNNIQDGRFWWMNNTHNFLQFGDVGGVPSEQILRTLIETPNGTLRHIDAHSTDVYWFAGAEAPFWRSVGGDLYSLGRDMTSDEMSRGSHYGDMVDWARSYQTTYSIPIFQIVELGGPYTENTLASNYITPPEINWAVWSSIIHGAQGIVYFNHTFAGPGDTFDAMADPYYDTIQPGQTISIYDQVNATDQRVAEMAPVINSPFVLDYAFLTGPGYEYGDGRNSTLGGLELMTKYYNETYYILADTRMSETQHNIPAMYTVNDPSAVSVTVLYENRTIPIVNGTFSDSFANAWDVHIYQVNDTGEPPPPDTTPPPAPIITGFADDTTPLGDHITTDHTLTLSGTAEAGSTVTLYEDDVSMGTTVATGGNWSFATGTLTDDTFHFSAKATDAAGNVSVEGAVFDITVLTPPPPPPPNLVINGTSGHDTLRGGAGNDTISGKGGQDQIKGEGGNDIIKGDGGKDFIDGGPGADTLTGGSGADTFIFKAGEANGDAIMDFAGNGARTGDIIMFDGYGDKEDGASFVRLDAIHWQVNSDDGAIHETITIANGAAVHQLDYLFI